MLMCRHSQPLTVFCTDVLLTDTASVVWCQSVAWFTHTAVSALLVNTLLFTATIVQQTLVYIFKEYTTNK